MNKTQVICYSPVAIDRYVITSMDKCEVRVVMNSSLAASAWNLFWLSHPTLDVLPEHARGPTPFAHYESVRNGLSSVFRDIRRDEALARKVVMNPDAFMDWFSRQRHWEFDCYQSFGKGWAATVLRRANDAALRLSSTDRPVSIKDNVIRINFGRAA
jgi:hypothetical protein